MLTVLFPGQGSQRRGMGKDLFPEFPELEQEADAILGYSIRELCTEDPQGTLARTQYTQPAIYVVNALSYLSRQKKSAVKPDWLAGHSLGEYNALWVAGCFDFGTGLRLVQRRGELMAKATGGGMAAVVGLELDAVRKVLEEPSLEGLELANLNTPKQFVLAGGVESIKAAKSTFEKSGATYIILPVSAPFHSRYMEGAKREFEQFLAGFELYDPEIPVIANTTARPYESGRVSETLTLQLRSSVLWCDSIRYLLGQGVTEFEEVGHGETLTKMLKAIQPSAPQPVPAPAPQAAPPPPPRVSIPVRTGPSRPAVSIATPAAARPIPAPRKRDEVSRMQLIGTPKRHELLGSASFRQEYGVRMAYVGGSMYRGIASEDMVVRMARSKLLAFFGTGGLSTERVEQAITRIRAELGHSRPATFDAALSHGETFGMNLLSTSREDALVDLFLKHGIDVIEASAYVTLTEALVRYRVAGLVRSSSGEVRATNRVVAKVSRPEVAEIFLRPPTERILRALVERKKITQEQARWAETIPMADDLCVEADSGGHTDGGVAMVLLPSMRRLRDRVAREVHNTQPVRVGLAGGIGTPESIVAAFVMGADFVLTGSINQCTVEAGHSDTVKGMLESIDVQDTDYAPAGDMFEVGAQVQVLKRGVFFPSRAKRLLELYRNFQSLDAIDADTRKQIEKNYFHRSFDDVFEEVKKYRNAQEIARAEKEPHYKMALVFKWYFAYTNQLAFAGKPESKTNYQVHCGPALGAFNQWVRGTELASWRARHVDDIAERLMSAAAALLSDRMLAYTNMQNVAIAAADSTGAVAAAG